MRRFSGLIVRVKNVYLFWFVINPQTQNIYVVSGLQAWSKKMAAIDVNRDTRSV